ncbi:MAG: short-chain dehydrogenase [Gammaproteobacteria bacterium BRH_c0]|nr:MAG: short-chain dehydrogenase [Gammaproteobacteria bacterium BRH_c0]
MTDNIKQSPGAALVIGGSGGLGRAICHALQKDWDGVFFTYHSNETAARELQAELSANGDCDCTAMDVRSTEAVQNAVDQAAARFGRIGTVVFASGATIGQPYVSQIEQNEWERVLDIELLGFTRLVRAVLPLFRSQGGGSLVSVVSFAPYHFPPGDALSSVPKAGIEVLCRAIAKEEGRYGIRANSVAPGIINAGLGDAFQKTLFTPEIWEAQRKRVPLKKFGEGEDIAEAVAFLASERSKYITGQTIIVDGGLSL